MIQRYAGKRLRTPEAYPIPSHPASSSQIAVTSRRMCQDDSGANGEGCTTHARGRIQDDGPWVVTSPLISSFPLRSHVEFAHSKTQARSGGGDDGAQHSVDSRMHY
jgi:hypothetical protein